MESKKAWVQVKIRAKKKKGIIFLSRPSKISVFLSSLSLVLVVGGLMAAGVPIVPMIWYRINPGAVGALEKVLKRPVVGFSDTLIKTGEIEIWQPEVDESLPIENRLIIPSIMVDTRIIEKPDSEYEQALSQGVWRVSGLGDPYNRQKPTVLVAHRFGYIAWSNLYRRHNSFFNLPKLKEGDRVEVIWNQRKYVYEIYGGEESEEIGNYTADLVLYTCKYLESEVRIFKYGRLVKSE